MTVALALTPDGHWNIPTADLEAAAKAAGFTSLGIHADRVDEGATDVYSSAGLGCHELLALVVGDDEGGRAEHRRTAGGHGRNAYPGADVVARCARILDAAGTGRAVEFSPFGPVSSIRDGLDVVRMATGAGRTGLLIDSWHVGFGDGTWKDLAEVPLSDIAYVQFTDALEPDALEPDSRDRLLRETLHRRALPADELARRRYDTAARYWR